MGRRGPWNSLLDVASTVCGSPWMIGGDFNVLSASSERIGSSHFDFNGTLEFNSFISTLSLLDIGSSRVYLPVVIIGRNPLLLVVGPSWLVSFQNLDWFFPISQIDNLAKACLDHILILISTSFYHSSRFVSSFKFQRMAIPWLLLMLGVFIGSL